MGELRLPGRNLLQPPFHSGLLQPQKSQIREDFHLEQSRLKLLSLLGLDLLLVVNLLTPPVARRLLAFHLERSLTVRSSLLEGVSHLAPLQLLLQKKVIKQS